MKCTSPSCSKAPPQHDAATPVLHGWDGVLQLASIPLFPLNITMVIMAKQFYFCFIRPEDISPKSTIFVHMCSCFGIDLHISHQSTFISRRQNASHSWAVWRLRGPMVFVLAYYCLYRWTWYLQAFVNWSQGWTRLVEVYNFFLADFFWFSHDVKQRGTEFEGRPWNTSTGTPPIDSNYVN